MQGAGQKLDFMSEKRQPGEQLSSWVVRGLAWWFNRFLVIIGLWDGELMILDLIRDWVWI